MKIKKYINPQDCRQVPQVIIFYGYLNALETKSQAETYFFCYILKQAFIQSIDKLNNFLGI